MRRSKQITEKAERQNFVNGNKMTAARKVAIGALILLLILLDSITIMRAIAGISPPYMQNYGENTILVNAWGLAAGHGLYRLSELEQIPIFVSTYPPVVYLLVAAGIALWGVTYVPGRVMVFLMLLGCSALIAGIARRRGCEMWVAAVAGLAFLGVFPIFRWCRYLRVDIPAVFFELLAVFIFLGRGSPIRRTAGFVILGLLAGYTKQSAFGLVLGALLGMALTGDFKDKKRAFFTGCAYGLGAALVFALLELFTGGSFHKFVIGSFSKRIEWEIFKERIVSLLNDPLSVTLILLGSIGACIGKQQLWNLAFCGVPFAWCLATVGYRGSGPNYFFEPLAAFCVSTALLLQYAQKPDIPRRKYRTAIVIAAMILGTLGTLFTRNVNLSFFMNFKRDAAILAQPSPAVLFMKERLPSGTYILTEDSDLPLLGGCMPVMSDPYILTMMAQEGKWDPSPVVEAVQNRRIALVMTSEKIGSSSPEQFLPREVLEAVAKNYAPVGMYANLTIYMPK